MLQENNKKLTAEQSVGAFETLKRDHGIHFGSYRFFGNPEDLKIAESIVASSELTGDILPQFNTVQYPDTIAIDDDVKNKYHLDLNFSADSVNDYTTKFRAWVQEWQTILKSGRVKTIAVLHEPFNELGSQLNKDFYRTGTMGLTDYVKAVYEVLESDFTKSLIGEERSFRVILPFSGAVFELIGPDATDADLKVKVIQDLVGLNKYLLKEKQSFWAYDSYSFFWGGCDADNTDCTKVKSEGFFASANDIMNTIPNFNRIAFQPAIENATTSENDKPVLLTPENFFLAETGYPSNSSNGRADAKLEYAKKFFESLRTVLNMDITDQEALDEWMSKEENIAAVTGGGYLWESFFNDINSPIYIGKFEPNWGNKSDSEKKAIVHTKILLKMVQTLRSVPQVCIFEAFDEPRKIKEPQEAYFGVMTDEGVFKFSN